MLFLHFLQIASEPEVNNHQTFAYLALLSKYDILQLDITMHNLSLMAEIDGTSYLMHNHLSIYFRNLPPRLLVNVFFQRSPLVVFHK